METLVAKELQIKPLLVCRIIAAVDLTSTSEATVRYAAKLARSHRASLCVACVFWPPLLSGGQFYYLVDKEQHELRRKLNLLIDHARAIVPWCKSAFLVGEPAERIASLARDVHADLIIAPGSYLRFLTRMFNLDTGARFVRQAPCPVLVYQVTDT